MENYTINKRITDFRIALNLSQEEAAKKVGMETEEYCRIENCVGTNLEELKAIANGFNTTVTSLIGSLNVETNDPAMIAYLVDNFQNSVLTFEAGSKYQNLNMTKSDAVEKISAMLRIFSSTEIKEVYDFVNSLYHNHYILKSK
ncbi:MAG: helix-turn-helix transcriptional regulator [Clostridia bacterium]|nr:helix-turn-helix transcriptional regulator [Clostridia bacterium]